jgi:hypothetical protein
MYMKGRSALSLMCVALGVLSMPMIATAATTCTGGQLTNQFLNIGVSNNQYRINNNFYNPPANSTAKLCIDYNYEATGKSFTARNSGGVSVPTNGAPSGYPSIYAGCHYGTCSTGSGMPIRVSDISTATSSWSIFTTNITGNWNASYDIWFNTTPSVPGQANGAELMIWLSKRGSIQPAGQLIASNVFVAGRSFDVWAGRLPGGSWNVISYVARNNTTSVQNLDLKAFFTDAGKRNNPVSGRPNLSSSWYLTSVQAGFEVWSGGNGLRNDFFNSIVRKK